MNEWNIQSRARTCQGCGRTFNDRESYHTLLFEQRSGFERLDVCGGCWDEQHRHGSADRKGFVSHWQGTFVVPPPPPPEPIQRDNAETLLRRLTERNDPAWQPAAFILAVMLERKRILRIREQFRKGGRRTFVYELHRSGEIFTIPDPDLQLDQLEKVQHDVAGLLEHGLPAESQPREEPFVPEMLVPVSLTGPAEEAGGEDAETGGPAGVGESGGTEGGSAIEPTDGGDAMSAETPGVEPAVSAVAVAVPSLPS